jgi:hypothetical protein
LRLAEKFTQIVRGLVVVEEWNELTLQLTVAEAVRAERAATLLAPANPGLFGRVIRFGVDRAGPGVGLEAVRRLLRRLDEERIEGDLELVSVRKALPEKQPKKETLREAWERHLGGLPPDWSDLYAQVQLDSTDFVERAALLLSPVNPARHGGPATLRFRCARRFGYGVSAEMAGRSLERCDNEAITGEIEILYVLSDTHPVATQGPVWLLGGKTV